MGFVEICSPFLFIRFSGEQLTIEKFLSLIINASGARLNSDNLEKKSNGSTFDLDLYLVQIFIW